jgi:lipoprotein-releasing system ATP-binding protein
MPELIVEHLSKDYPTRTEPLSVLRDITLKLSFRDNVAVLGPSGSGKSTFLHVLGTLEPPTMGTVQLLGKDPFQMEEPELARFRNRNIGFIFQEHHLLPQLSVLENVIVPALAEGAATPAINERAKNLIERVGLSERLDHRPGELSGGERQRVAVARAMLMKPALLLGDEPTGSLDRTNARSIGQLLLELQKDEDNILMVVTHSQELAALFSRRFELDGGRLRELKIS